MPVYRHVSSQKLLNECQLRFSVRESARKPLVDLIFIPTMPLFKFPQPCI